jgi:hypothetical protein
MATRAATIDRLRARRKTATHPPEQQSATASSTPNQGVFRRDWSH